MGKRSGAHFYPAITLTYYRLGKVAPTDAVFYSFFQFIGGIARVGVALNMEVNSDVVCSHHFRTCWAIQIGAIMKPSEKPDLRMQLQRK
jgi:glycerol uptake facilitator-like aquaporin